jgi:ankyrin repeat protein
MAATLYAGADCVKLLLDRGANPNARNASGATALMWAVPDIAKTKLLIAAGADVNAKSTNLQRTPLLIAASYPGAAAVLRLLLDHGADLQAKDRNGMHALGRAAVTGDVEVVRLLVERGLEPGGPGYGVANLRMLFRHYLPTLEYLLSHGARVDKDALPAAYWEEPTLIEKWIEAGADVNARMGNYKRTALMTAATSEHAGVATIKLLLEKGADPNTEDVDGERPLDWAVYRNDRSKIEALEQFGAKRGHGPRQKVYPGPQPGGIADPRLSIDRALSLLLPTAPIAYQRRGCITCHSQALVAVAAAAARKKGIPINEEMESTNLKQIVAAYKIVAEQAMQGDQPLGNSITMGYVMLALAAEQHPFDQIPAALMHITAGLQLPDGSWTPNAGRPPMEDSLVTATAMGVRVLTLYPMAAAREQLAEKLQQAQRWLLSVDARSAEDRAMRLMGLVWSRASRAEVDSRVRQVLGQQQSSGGWAQRVELEPDAYATGMSLYALRTAGVPATNEAYRKGIQFLLRNQYQDGAWLVKTRSYPIQAYFESGYPFGNNQFISAAGANWAILAIAETLPNAVRADGTQDSHR